MDEDGHRGSWVSSPPVNRTSPAVVLVTGGSGVIGGAVCRRFGSAGCAVAVHYCQRVERAELVARDIRDRGAAITVQADLREAVSVSHMIETVLDRFGRLDVLVCAAGRSISQLVLRTSLEVWHDLLGLNLTGTFYTLRAVTPYFQMQRNGAAILIGSFSGQHGRAGQAAYATSKAGLLGLMRATAKEWGPYRARINMVFPGWQRSSLTATFMPDESELDDHVLRRTPALHEVVDLVYALAWMKDVSGQVWNFDSRIG